MTLHKIIVELRYKKAAHPFTFRSKIFKEITGNLPDRNPVIRESISIEIKDKLAKVIIEPNRWVVSIEKIEGVSEIKEYLEKLNNKLHAAAVWKEAVRIGVRTIWIQGTDQTSSQLISQFKERLFKTNSLISESEDVALPLTLKKGEVRINYIAGPVTKEEIKEKHLDNDSDTLPEAGLLVDIDYLLVKEMEYPKQKFKKFLADALEYSERKAAETNELVL
jgi:hypothetical protein